ncbi:hypothetical protein Tco_1077553 [Tanacetum coccineum]
MKDLFRRGHFRKHSLKGMKDKYNADIRAINILFQGLPKDIYTLINHYTDAKDIWDRMLLKGSGLTKEDRESQLYDDFEHFCQNKGETIHDYYVRFTKLINDMRNIKMTMPRMQLNSKFVNNMLLEWGRFVTAVKLNRGLKESNYDQMYAYLKQHEAHANKNKMMLERFTQHTVDPLVLMSNVSPQLHSLQSPTTLPSKHVPPGRQNRGQGNHPRGAGEAGNGGVQNRVENTNPGQARQIKCYNCNAQENSVVLDEEQLLFLVDDECDAFDLDVDEAPTAQTMFMANLSSVDPVYDESSPLYDSDILSEEKVELYERRAKFELIEREQKIEEQLRIVITDRNIKEENLKKELHSVKMQLNSTINHNKSMVEEVTSLKKDFK